MNNVITPIETYKNILLKRDDKYIIEDCNGGKLRQAYELIKKNLNNIKNKYNNTIVCFCSIKSPQSAIISVVCKIYDIKCIIITHKTKKPNINLTIAQNNGAFIYGVKAKYESNFNYYSNKYFSDCFIVKRGFEERDIINTIKNQVVNIPDDLDYLIITIGSAMNFIGILEGLEQYNKKVKNIIGIYVGKQPYNTINKYYKGSLKYKLYKSCFQYTKEINIDNYFFDPIYEAKGYKWLVENIDINNNKCLFWVIGKRNLKIQPQEINYLDLNILNIKQKKLICYMG